MNENDDGESSHGAFTPTPRGDHWTRHAQQWALVGPPLRPAPSDVAALHTWLMRWQGERCGRPLRVLLLGVTPELATLSWPPHTTLTAVDRSASMIAQVFPTEGVPEGARAVEGEWLSLPFDDAAFDLVLGDGCLSTLAFPGPYEQFAMEARRVLDREGRLVLRIFAAPTVRESVEAVEAALMAKAIGNFHVLKWRLAMALERSPHVGVRLGDIFRAFTTMAEDRHALAQALGWDPEVIGTIDNYAGSEARYTFPSEDEVLEVLAPSFVKGSRDVPTYELGERCPTLFFAPR